LAVNNTGKGGGKSSLPEGWFKSNPEYPEKEKPFVKREVILVLTGR